ncbi:hypothetical protein BH09BAC1_BH09BAC1_02600 [soil metagenome]
MKAIFSLFVIMSICVVGFAQGNLQFNQVITQSINTAFAAGSSRPGTSVTLTVPAGKVWKIESAHVSSQSSSSSNQYNISTGSSTVCYIILDEAIIATFDSYAPLVGGAIWLKEGTHTLLLQGYVNSSSTYKFNGLVTGIEFNIVP